MSHDRPHALLITRNLPPLRGGMERLNLQIARSLAEWTHLSIIGPNGCRDHLPTEIEVCEVPARPLWRFLLSASLAISTATLKPFQFILAGSGLTAPFAAVAAKRVNAKSIVYVHGLDLVASHLLYRRFWIPQLRKVDLVLANSGNTADLAVQHGVACGRVQVIHPGCAFPDRASQDAGGFRSRYQINQRPLLLSVGRLTARKGLFEFIRYALPEIQSQYPDVVLVVIGDDAHDALSGTVRGSRAAVKKLAMELGLDGNVMMLGPADDETLAEAYYAADAHVFPVRQVPGDVEGFGMVAIEAAAHGCPTVAFDVGGVADAVEEGLSGYLVQSGEYHQFAWRVCEILECRESSPWARPARAMAESFTWDRFAAQLKGAVISSVHSTF